MDILRARTLAMLMAAAAIASPAAAQQTSGDSAQVHVVRPGDTLWDLAGRYLGDPYQWQEIYRLNQQRLANPHLIFPTDRLLIPGLTARVAQQRPATPAAQPARTVFYRPQGTESAGPTVRTVTQASAPVVDRGEFLAAAMLVAEGEVRPVGRLTELVSPTVVPVEIPAHARVYEQVYMAIAVPGTVRVGERLHLMRAGRSIRPHGQVLEPTGVAVVEAVEGGTATLRVEELYDAVGVGDLALPLPTYRVPAGVRPRANAGLESRIIAFEDPQPVHASFDVAFLDVGRADGVTEGDEFVAVLAAEEKSWGHRPEILVARLQVIRVAERTASARVMEMEHPALEPGLAVRQVVKIPQRPGRGRPPHGRDALPQPGGASTHFPRRRSVRWSSGFTSWPCCCTRPPPACWGCRSPMPPRAWRDTRARCSRGGSPCTPSP